MLNRVCDDDTTWSVRSETRLALSDHVDFSMTMDPEIGKRCDLILFSTRAHTRLVRKDTTVKLARNDV